RPTTSCSARPTATLGCSGRPAIAIRTGRSWQKPSCAAESPSTGRSHRHTADSSPSRQPHPRHGFARPGDPMTAYLDFLRQKIRLADFAGFEVDASEINPLLKPHQRAIVKWAVRGGLRAIFA